MRNALITGITGQDGSYLAELLLEKGYRVHGLMRRTSGYNLSRIEHLLENPSFSLHESDLSDSSSLRNLIDRLAPNEIYNLAAMSHVKTSFDIPEYTADVNAIGPLRILEAIRSVNPKIKFYQASTSELFGKVIETPQSEKTPFYPRSPYGVAKLFGYWTTVNYREAYGLFASNGILFNHESPRRTETFVSRKISLAVCRIKREKQKKLILGNLGARRDWGYAKDFVEGMWRMLQQEKADDFVLATGKTHSVREFAELAFREVDIEIVWQGSGVQEKGIDAKTGNILVEVSPEFFRPTEVDLLLGDPSKAKKEMGWSDQTSFEELVSIMIKADLCEEACARS